MAKHDIPTCTEHNVWKGMWYRCNNPKSKPYPNYGGRGIKVCDRWRDFYLFLEDIGRKPVGMSLDRIDNEGNYEPLNCRWATARQQSANQRTSHRLKFDGETVPLMEICRRTGIAQTTLLKRLRETDFDVDAAIELIDVAKELQEIKYYKVDGKTYSLTDLAVAFKIGKQLLWQRIERDGMTPTDAVKQQLNPGGGKLTKWKGKLRSKQAICDMEDIKRSTFNRALEKYDGDVAKSVKHCKQAIPSLELKWKKKIRSQNEICQMEGISPMTFSRALKKSGSVRKAVNACRN